MWFSTDTFQILSRELPEQSGRQERARVLEEMWRAGNNEMVTGTGLLLLKKKRPHLPIFCWLKCHNVKGRILDVSWWLAEGSYWTCSHPMRPERVCRGCLRTMRKQTHELYSTLESWLLEVISKLTCCAVIQVFSSSFWRTEKISVKKFGWSPVYPEQRDTFQSTRSHWLRRRGSRC